MSINECNTCLHFGSTITDIAKCAMCEKWFHAECTQFHPFINFEGRFARVREFIRINPTPVNYTHSVVCHTCVYNNSEVFSSHIGLD